MMRRGFSYGNTGGGGGGGTPGGADTQVQFNDGGAFAGDSGFVFNKTNNTIDLGGATIVASDPILDLSQTWNNAAVAFTGVKVNVTSTASAADSKLLDVQVGGSSIVSATATQLIAPAGSVLAAGNPGIVFQGVVGRYGISANTGNLSFWAAGLIAINISNANEVRFGRDWNFSWSANVDNNASADLKIMRDGAGVLAQRNTTNAQTFRVYDTYTDASNYGRLALNTNLTGDWVQVAAETAGTGGDNYGIALTPTGTGAISAHVPDSTTAGGNARGANAVDWQTVARSAATQVASGTNSTIGGGIQNTASGQASTVAGGSINVASGVYASVVGGQSNNATGTYAVASGGYVNTASGESSWVPGGANATTRGITHAGAYSQLSRAAVGDRQTMVLPIACAARTDATPTVMTSNAGAASTTNQMVLPNNSSMFFEVDVVAHDTTLKSASWKVQGTIRRGANAAATAIVGTNVTTAFGSDLSGGSPGVTCTADTTNGALAVTFTGIAATTIYPSGHIRTVIAA